MIKEHLHSYLINTWRPQVL